MKLTTFKRRTMQLWVNRLSSQRLPDRAGASYMQNINVAPAAARAPCIRQVINTDSFHQLFHNKFNKSWIMDVFSSTAVPLK